MRGFHKANVAPDVAFLDGTILSLSQIRYATREAERQKTDVATQIIALGMVNEETYYKKAASELGLAYLSPDDLKNYEILEVSEPIRTTRKEGGTVLLKTPDGYLRVLAPRSDDLEGLRQTRQHNGVRIGAIASKSALAKIVRERHSDQFASYASFSLKKHFPLKSAEKIEHVKSAAFICTLLTLILFLGAWPSAIITHGIAILLSILFLFAVGLRCAATFSFKTNKQRISGDFSPATGELPTYSVLVALYDEANVVSELIQSLEWLDWPISKLDIKFLLEFDDCATIATVERAIRNKHQFEMIIVPAGNPRTKPRALNYGLALSRGDYVVVYDAEDRPHPQQLQEAYNRFQKAEQDVACLQAPLLADNAEDTWYSGHFKLEYAALFDGLLPFLAAKKFPLMLGGTSNHFNVKVLRGVGAWDPFNVTEDADLGIRLSRAGYRTDVLNLPTYEEAPTNWKVWSNQRTRWFKGWMQTIFVNMREPARLFSQLGFLNALVYHLISTVLLISVLGHPLFLILLINNLAYEQANTVLSLFYAVSCGLLFVSYGAQACLSWLANRYRDTKFHILTALGIPFY